MTPAELRAAGITDKRVLAALAATDRSTFSISEGQVIAPEEAVGLMVQLVASARPRYVAEIGTGSGYGTCVLARTLPDACIDTYERHFKLYNAARARVFHEYDADDRVEYHWASGENLTRLYDAILCTCGINHEQAKRYTLNAPLVVAPIGDGLYRVTRGETGPVFDRVFAIAGATPMKRGVE